MYLFDNTIRYYSPERATGILHMYHMTDLLFRLGTCEPKNIEILHTKHNNCTAIDYFQMFGTKKSESDQVMVNVVVVILY